MNTKKRNAAIAAALPEALDLWVIVMQAGLDFQVAIAEYLRRLPGGVLGEELQAYQADLQSGHSRLEAMQHLHARVSDSSFREFTRAVMQGLELGTPLTPVLKNLAQSLRQRRSLDAERRAALAPLKLMFPLFVFIFPTLFIVLLGPVWLAVSKGHLP